VTAAPAVDAAEAAARREIEAANRLAGRDAIRIGVLTPLTPPGDTYAGGLVARGARLGAEYVHEHGGVRGRRVELVLQNDQETTLEEGMAASAARGLRRLVDEQGVLAALGQWHLRTAGAVAETAEELGVPVFIENGHSTVTEGRRTVFRTYFSIADRVPLMLDFLASQGLRRLAVLVADTVFGLTTADELERYGRREHGMELLRFDFPQETVEDVRAELRQVREWAPDAIVNDGVIRTNYLFLAQAAELRLRPSVPMMVTFGFPMRSADFWRLAGPAGNGILWPATRYRPSWDGLTEIGRWFTARYVERYRDFPPDTALSAFTDVTILARALEAAESDRREELIEALESQEFQTWRGPVRFVRGPRHWHHTPPDLLLMQYQEVGQSFDEAAIVYPSAERTRPYRPPEELG